MGGYCTCKLVLVTEIYDIQTIILKPKSTVCYMYVHICVCECHQYIINIIIFKIAGANQGGGLKKFKKKTTTTISGKLQLQRWMQ